jgi:putative ABC transport system permease protein
MLRNYVVIALRNLLKHRFYAFVNAFGLSIGIAFCLLIYLFIRDERRFDNFHENGDRIYRMEEVSYDTELAADSEAPSPYRRSAYLQAGLGPAMKDELPEVEHFTRFTGGGTVVRHGDKVFSEDIKYVDSGFFRMFTFPLIRGNAGRLFRSKDEVVITRSIAEKYFGDEDPVGKILLIGSEEPVTHSVTAVIEDPPAHSSLDFKLLLPTESQEWYGRNLEQWGNFSYPMFVMLRPGSNMTAFRAKLEPLVTKYMGDRLERWRERYKIPQDYKVFELDLAPLGSIHNRTEVSWHKVSDPKLSLILGGIAVLIVVIACINYVSLALTSSTARKLEVGVRKVAGAMQKQLIVQFGVESLVLATLSMVFAVALMSVFLPKFNEFTQKTIDISPADWLTVGLVLVALTLIVGTLAGSYPAFYLSGSKPSVVLKGRSSSKYSTRFSRFLVVLQFFFSAALVICSVVMMRQLNYIATKDLGYNGDQVLVIPSHTGWSEEGNLIVERFRTRVAPDPRILSVSGTSSSFNQGWSRYGFTIDGENRAAYVYVVDPYYVETLDIELAAGRNFDVNIPSDKENTILVNEALVRYMGWAEPLNSYLNWREDSAGQGARVIGVLKDYHYLSLEQEIEPLFLTLDKEAGYMSTLLVKIAAGDIPAAVESLKKAWNEVAPGKPFDYTFMDDDVARQYESSQRWMKIMALSTGFAILIACLGLFGLAGINAVNRTKEVGIRKAMGAGVMQIILLLNRQFVWLAVVAFLLAAPVAWYVMSQWLESFRYAIDMDWRLFGACLAVGLALALATVSYHSIKASMINPAETLKYE